MHGATKFGCSHRTHEASRRRSIARIGLRPPAFWNSSRAMDRLTPERRSRLMSKVGSKNTGPELAVRAALSELDFRYRLHARNLPGRPDIANRKRKIAVFVHGCYWHAHGCKIGRPPKSNLDFWLPKLARNKARDAAALRALRRAGWRAVVVWQCETRDIHRLRAKLRRVLDGSDNHQRARRR